MTAFELIRCTNCHHERVRSREGQFYLPCVACGCEDCEVFDLVPVERDLEMKYAPTPEGLACFEEVMLCR